MRRFALSLSRSALARSAHPSRMVVMARPLAVIRFNSTDASKAEEQKQQQQQQQQEQEQQQKGEESQQQAPIDPVVAAKRITELEQQVRDLQEKCLRTFADLENMKIRSDKRIADANKFALQRFSKELIGVADVLGMTVSGVSAEDKAANARLSAFLEGVEGTNKMLLKIFEDFGIKRIWPVGETFDPNSHEALFQIPTSEDGKNNTVGQVVKAGYFLHDRILRPAQVGVFQKM